MSGMERDPELEEFLKRRSPLHRRMADLDDVEPPAELDRLVLSRAREAIETPANPPIYRATRWAMPVGLAATILIAFTVVLNVERHAAAPGPTSVSSMTRTETSVAREAAVTTQAANSSERVQTRTPGTRAGAAAAISDSSASVAMQVRPEPAEVRRAAKAEASLADRAFASTRSAAPLAPAPSVAATPSEAAPSVAAEPPVAQANAGRADADSWLREIARLRAEGKAAEAERELEAFRRAHPSHAGPSLAEPPTR